MNILKLLIPGSWSFVHCDGYFEEEKGWAEGGGEKAKAGRKLSQWNQQRKRDTQTPIICLNINEAQKHSPKF